MSIGATLIGAGLDVNLSIHGVSVQHIPLSGPAQTLVALDNGTPEDIAFRVDGVSRTLTVKRTLATYTQGDSIRIGTSIFRVIGVRYVNEHAVSLLLGATAVSGAQ